MSAENVAVVSAHRYRAECVALALSCHSDFRATPFTQLDFQALNDFGIIAIDLSATLDATLEMIHSITMQCPKSKVIVLGLPESEESVVKLAAAGASGYASPDCSSKELISILQAVGNNEFTCPPNITHALFSHLAYLASAEGRPPSLSAVLTTRETKILHLLSQKLTNKEIAVRLGISQYTAKNHVHRILKKLGVRNRSSASHWLQPPY